MNIFILHTASSNNNQRGFLTLMSVLIVSAVGMSIAISLLLLGLGASRTSFAIEQSYQANSLAGACVEEGLEQIREVPAYTGTGNLSLGQGTCSYEVTSQGGENRTITTTGTVGTVIRRLLVVISALDPSIIVASWQEVTI